MVNTRNRFPESYQVDDIDCCGNVIDFRHAVIQRIIGGEEVQISSREYHKSELLSLDRDTCCMLEEQKANRTVRRRSRNHEG